MSGESSAGVVSQFLRKFLASIGLMFVPLPIGIFKRQLAGRIDRKGTLEFYSHPNFICTMHLIWVGWLVTLAEFYNGWARAGNHYVLDDRWLIWPWIVVLLLTLIVMGLQFGRVQVGFLIAVIAVTGLGLGLIEALSDVTIFATLRRWLGKIPVVADWGVPFSVSLVLGILFVAVAAWRRLNDRWILQETGNYLEHANFQERDRTISKGAKTFVAVYPCLLRRYLLFGFGDIEVRSSTGEKLIDRIEGVLLAKRHTELIKHRFGTTDIRAALAEEESDEEEISEDEAL